MDTGHLLMGYLSNMKISHGVVLSKVSVRDREKLLLLFLCKENSTFRYVKDIDILSYRIPLYGEFITKL